MVGIDQAFCAKKISSGFSESSGLADIRTVPIAQHSRDFPSRFGVVPNDGEIRESFAFSARDLAEAVRTLFDGAEVFDGVDPEAAGYEFAREVAADVFPCIRQHVGAVPCHSSGVMVELHILGEEVGMPFKLLRVRAAVERVEGCRVQSGDGALQRFCGTVVRRLRVGGTSGDGQTRCDHQHEKFQTSLRKVERRP